MELYSLLRLFADSWFLIAMVMFFVGAILFVLRPGSRKIQADAASIPFRHEDAPLSDTKDRK